MTNFIRIGNKYLNADHIVLLVPCKSSFDYNTEIWLDVADKNGEMSDIRVEETPEELIEKICGKEIFDE